MTAVAVGALGACLLVALAALALAERRVHRYAARALELIDRLERVRVEHAQERTDWAAAAAAERDQLRREAADDRAALIATIGMPQQAMTPWPAGLEPPMLDRDDEPTERARVAAAIDAELAARDTMLDG